MNYKVMYQHEGYHCMEVVAAETADAAEELVEQLKPGCIIYGAKPTTEPTTEETTAAFLAKMGARSVEEWLAYQAFCQPLWDAAMAREQELLDEIEEEAEKTGDWDKYYEFFEGKMDYNPPTIEEWREMNK